jgi:hypothetical protein
LTLQVFIAVDIAEVIRSAGIGIVIAIITILRCPLSAFVTYKVSPSLTILCQIFQI